jgi:hypothetical protein
MERADYTRTIEEYQRLYWASPDATSITNQPLTGGSTLVIPLAAISIEAFHARSMTTIFALDDFVQVKLPAKYDHLEFGLEKLLDHEFITVGNLYKCLDNTLLEGTKLGTGVAKSGYIDKRKRAVRYDSNGDRQEIEVSVKRGVTFDAVQVANFLMPYAYTDPQTAPWCGEEHEKSLYEVKCMEDNDFFYKGVYEKVLSAYTPMAPLTPGAQVTQNQQQMENKVPILPKLVRFYEVWLSFDVDTGNDIYVNVDDPTSSYNEKEIVVYFEPLTDTIMGIRYNWYDDLHRPYRHYNHFPIEHRWTGVGMCKMLEQFQIEITTQHRQTIDSATLANLRMFKIKKLSGFSPNEPVYAGKLWFVDEMEDIEPLQLGEVYPSSYNSEASALNYAQQRSAINELNLGMPQSGTPGTAADVLTRVQEGKARFDYTHKNVRRFASQLNHDGICNLVQFGARNATIYNEIPNGEEVRQFIEQNPISMFRDSIIVDVNIAGQNQNKLLDRASWTQLSGMAQQYWASMIQLGMQVDPSLGRRFSIEAIEAGTLTWQEILQSFDIRNVDKLAVDRALISMLTKSLNMQNGTQTATPGLLPGPGQTFQPSGVALPDTLSAQVGGSVA